MRDKEKFFTRIYETSKDKIHRLCLGFTGNPADADDLFQEIWLKVWKNLEKFRGESHIHTWIYRIATNTALSFVKKNKKTLHLREVSCESQETPNPEVRKLYQAIASLNDLEKTIICLFLEECSYAEISGITGLSVPNVGVKIHRIKQKLKQKLNDYERMEKTMATGKS